MHGQFWVIRQQLLSRCWSTPGALTELPGPALRCGKLPSSPPSPGRLATLSALSSSFAIFSYWHFPEQNPCVFTPRLVPTSRSTQPRTGHNSM